VRHRANLRRASLSAVVARIPPRVLEFFAPGGFERWFEELAALMGGDAPDVDAIVASARRFGTEMDFESLPLLMERHGLTFSEAP
jgi:hypothetical protein